MNEIILSNIRPPVIAECGLLAATEPFYHMNRIADFNVLIYVTDGAIHVTEDGIDYEAKPGEILFLKSGIHHWGNREIKKGTRWYYFHFYDNDPKPPNIRFEFEREIKLPKKLSGLQNSRFEYMTKKYTDHFYSNDPMNLWNANSKLFDILTEIAFCGNADNEPQSLSDKICAYLTEHYSEPFRASVLEREFYLSYKHMAAVFKRERKMTMQQYHTNVRMNIARRLLRSTFMSVSDVSAAVGYTDALYFSRQFRSVAGLCPIAYRKSVLEGKQ
ncbi:MAG: helix-turn-helix transcriptional regulator [Oscillospiraceae bacterium]|nr:helix-turn-helix transcriptional regulator [Oscillospiraceae bacterium]